MSEQQEFCSVVIQDLPTDKPFKYDVYIKLADKYLKVAPAGETLSSERLAAYQAKGAQDLYLTRQDFSEYIGMALPVLEALDQGRRVKLEELRKEADATMSLLYTNDMNEILFENARSTVTNVVDTAAANPTVLDLLETMKNCTSEGYLYQHGVAVSLFAVMIGKAMGWESTANLFKLALGASLHDLGMKSIKPNLHLKPMDKMSEAERTEFERHTILGAQLVAVVSSVPADVLSIIMEHHETCGGVGFPRRLGKQRIHPMAKVVAVADRFCELTMPDGVAAPKNPIDAATEIMACSDYDPEVLKAFQTLFVGLAEERKNAV